RRGSRFLFYPGRAQVGVAVQLLGGVDWPSRRHLLGTIELEEHRFQGLDQGNVQPVHPDDALLSLVAVIVPGPTGCQYEISRLHIDTLPSDRGISTASFNDKADRRRAVAVRARHFTPPEDLHRGDEVVFRRPAAPQAR